MNLTLPCLVFEDEKSAREASYLLLEKILSTIAEDKNTEDTLKIMGDAAELSSSQNATSCTYVVPGKGIGFDIIFNMRKMNYLRGNKRKTHYSGLVNIEVLRRGRFVSEIKPYEDEKSLSDDVHKAYREFVGRYDIKDGIARSKEKKK